MKKKTKVKPRHLLFKEAIKNSGLKQSWVAEKMGISDTHLSNMLADVYKLKEEHIAKLNEVLETNF